MTSTPPSKRSDSSQPSAVEWHNFTLKELLQISSQNQWSDVAKDVTSLVVSLSKYNPIKTTQQTASPLSCSTLSPSATNTETSTDEKSDMDTDEVALSGSDALSVVSAMKAELECDICLDCYIEPLTLSCGHSFCRTCIMQINAKCKKKCPLCKTCAHVDAALHPQNVVLSNCVRTAFSSQHYAARVAHCDKAKEEAQRNIPVFIMNAVRYPGMLLDLHLFEPRYLHMINRAISSGNRFAYVCKGMNDNEGGYRPYDDDIALLVKIRECQFLPSGRCLMQGLMEKRILVSSSWVEDGTQGLWYVKYSDYKDGSAQVADDGQNEEQTEGSGAVDDALDETQVKLITKFVEHMYGQSNGIIRSIENECGQRVHLSNGNQEQWSFWICSMVYVVMKSNLSPQWVKEQLHTKDTAGRVKRCYVVLSAGNQPWNSDNSTSS